MNYLLVLLFPLLAACGALGPLATGKVDPSANQIQVQAQKAINEANGTLAALYATIAGNARDGIWTKEQGREYIAKADAFAAKVDQAQAFVRTGQFDAAKAQALAVSALIRALHEEAIQAAAQKKTEFTEWSFA